MKNHPHHSPEALEQLVTKIFLACHRQMGGRLSNADLDDALQETLIQTWYKQQDGGEEGLGQGLIWGIARICILRQRRAISSQRSQPFIPDLAAHEPGEIPDTAIDTAFRDIVDLALAEEGTTAECILRLRSEEGDSFPVIARKLARTEALVKSRYYRALTGVRSRLQYLWADLRGQ